MSTVEQHLFRLRAVLLGSVGAALAGCSHGPPGESSSASTVSATASASLPLRTGPAQCDSARSYTPCKGTEADLRCKTNADCNDRRVGMCASREAVPAATMRAATPASCDCIYGCSVDADCAPGELCVCGAQLGGGASQCVPASCASGADCESGVCALSIYNDGCSSTRVIACKTAADECSSDADCKPNERKKPTRCVYVEERQAKPRWACRSAECQVGRPLLVNGVAQAAPLVLRSDWLAPAMEGSSAELSSEEKASVVKHWQRAAALEHASIASFARFCLQLLAMGAPADLVAGAQEAMRDEIEHARTCFAIARMYGSESWGPAALPAATMPISNDVREMAAALIEEGCVGEALAAAEAAILADRCDVPSVARALRQIAEDEQRHAALAYRALAWMASVHGEIVRELVEATLAEPDRENVSQAPLTKSGLARHGVVGDDESEVLKALTHAVAIRPALGSVWSCAGGPA